MVWRSIRTSSLSPSAIYRSVEATVPFAYLCISCLYLRDFAYFPGTSSRYWSSLSYPKDACQRRILVKNTVTKNALGRARHPVSRAWIVIKLGYSMGLCNLAVGNDLNVCHCSRWELFFQ